MIILIIIFGFIYYIFNELEDECRGNTWKIFPNILNSENTWKNKWKLDENNNLTPYKSKWYHFGINPHNEEKFPYSSTIFVSITDSEHLFQGIKNLAIYIGFWVIGFKYFIMFFIGKNLASFVKEKFLTLYLK